MLVVVASFLLIWPGDKLLRFILLAHVEAGNDVEEDGGWETSPKGFINRVNWKEGQAPAGHTRLMKKERRKEGANMYLPAESGKSSVAEKPLNGRQHADWSSLEMKTPTLEADEP